MVVDDDAVVERLHDTGFGRAFPAVRTPIASLDAPALFGPDRLDALRPGVRRLCRGIGAGRPSSILAPVGLGLPCALGISGALATLPCIVALAGTFLCAVEYRCRILAAFVRPLTIVPVADLVPVCGFVSLTRFRADGPASGLA
ncbi:hypothetical protein [Mesorhizobium xinjiangense]|uniref:hypothetical protein n=1 Tax=Mesorhizobium xinjiangense TaxID=2678685 RepID=UPI0018DE7B44|nr:hypothetical protein [Mesorhizobium xinjiangense]